MHIGQLLKETIILLVALQVMWILLPNWLKKTLRGLTKLMTMCGKEVTLYAKRAFKESYKHNKKVAPRKSETEQPSNVIKITYPDGRVKTYPKAK